MNYLAVQIVDVKYGKAERGGEGARARARLPIALPLPPCDGRGVPHQCGLVYFLGEPDLLVDLRRDLLRLTRRKIRRA